MLQPQVTLKSGGYIIINQTEALVSIDVNSGRSTREHSIEETALQTNLEAAEEVARQLRLRDLAGLIVIDFIDMDEKRNNRAVEKKIKDCLKQDRARIQVGRISHFGLLEMSRQRIRASVLESAMRPCPHCGGIGLIRSDSAEALHVIRSIEEYCLKNSSHDIIVRTSTHSALYILNEKRSNVQELEDRFGLHIKLVADDSLGSQHYAIEKGEPAQGVVRITEPAQIADYGEDQDPEIPADVDEEETVSKAGAESDQDADGDGNRKRKRRRRRRRGGRDRDDTAEAAAADGDDDAEYASDEPETSSRESGEDGDLKRKRRRGRRGGRRNRRDRDSDGVVLASGPLPEPELVGFDADEIAALMAAFEQDSGSDTEDDDDGAAIADAASDAANDDTADTPPPVKDRSRAKEPAEPAVVDNADEVAQNQEKPRRRAATREKAEPVEPVVVSSGTADEAEPQAETEDKPKRAGWWQRRSFF